MELIAEKSTGQSKHDATSYMKKMSEFPFIMTAVTTQYVLAFIHPLSVALQSKTCDLLQAHTECRSLLELIAMEQCEGSLKKLFLRATQVLKDTFGEEEESTCPRSNSRKRHMHRSNDPAATPEGLYRLN